jgi:HEAT repeat protein
MNVDRRIVGALFLALLLPAGARAESPEWMQASTRRDSSAALYREGYRLILDERWSEARAKFNDMLRRFPGSRYVDDARFWSAYSWKATSPQKALEAYGRFIKEFPRSNYFDDAVAEYERLGGRPLQASAPATRNIPQVAIRMAELEQELAQLQHRYRSLGEVRPPAPPEIRVSRGETMLKVETLRALGRSPDDPEAFGALKEAALSPSQPIEVRVTALDAARRSTLPEAGTLLVGIAQSDPDIRLRVMALDGLRFQPHATDPEPIRVVRSIAMDGSEPVQLRLMAIQVLEQRGDAELPHCLVQIASSGSERELQKVALMNLARNPRQDRENLTVLFQRVARDSERDPAVRETALFGLQQMQGAQAIPFLVETARHDQEERMREMAVISLGAIARGSETLPVSALRDLAVDRSLPSQLRQAALAQAVDAEKNPDIAFLERLAAEEPDEEVQQMALHVISRATRGSPHSFELLSQLYRALPPERVRGRETLLYAIATIGSEESVGFLADVARNADPPLRQRAVFYLGTIGTDAARRALLEILKSPG